MRKKRWQSLVIGFDGDGEIRAQDLALAAGIAAVHVAFHGQDIALGIHFFGWFEGLFRAQLNADLTALAVFGVDVEFVHLFSFPVENELKAEGSKLKAFN